MRPLILIGMPWSGKSTVGRAVASANNLTFVDTDDLIRLHTRKTLPELIAMGGDVFSRAEEEAIYAVPREDAIIATGGSVVYSERAMAYLNAIGNVFFLNISKEEFLRRATNPEERGIVIGEGMTIGDLYDYRQPYYRRYARTTITEDCLNASVDIINTIIRLDNSN